jgi:deazaflavin-dependent oxidoreductase (nitroreductase family)
MLITTLGRKTGKARTVPAGYLWQDGHFVVCVVPGGPDATLPGWYHNLRATPHATVDLGAEKLEVTAEELPVGAERDHLWQRFVAAYPLIGAFQRRHERLIPIVMLTPVD